MPDIKTTAAINPTAAAANTQKNDLPNLAGSLAKNAGYSLMGPFQFLFPERRDTAAKAGEAVKHVATEAGWATTGALQLFNGERREALFRTVENAWKKFF